MSAVFATPAEARVLSPAVCQRINRRIEDEQRHPNAERNWLPSLVEQQRPLRLSYEFMKPRLPYFRTMLLEGGPVQYPDCQVPTIPSWFSIDPLSHIVRSRRQLAGQRRVQEALLRRERVLRVHFDEDLIGWPYHSRRFVLWGQAETAANLNKSLYYSLLSHFVDLSRVSRVVDIGGGYGGLLSGILASHQHIEGCLIEMPYLCVVADYYLGRKFGEVSLVDDEPLSGQARVSVMLPWMFDRLTATLDLAINTMSFQHMAQANHEYYFSNLARLGVKQLFSVNREHGTREGEAPFLSTAYKYGYRLEKTITLDPWSAEHRVHLLVA